MPGRAGLVTLERSRLVRHCARSVDMGGMGLVGQNRAARGVTLSPEVKRRVDRRHCYHAVLGRVVYFSSLDSSGSAFSSRSPGQRCPPQLGRAARGIMANLEKLQYLSAVSKITSGMLRGACGD